MKLWSVTLLAVSFYLASSTFAFAALVTPTCQPIYGGGIYDCSKQSLSPISPVPQSVQTKDNSNFSKFNFPQNTPTPLPTIVDTKQSKGGQPVYDTSANKNVNQTPPTGPEALALAAFLPAGLLGSFLRRKSL